MQNDRNVRKPDNTLYEYLLKKNLAYTASVTTSLEENQRPFRFFPLRQNMVVGRSQIW